MSIKIIVLGANCGKCKRTERKIRAIIKEYNIEASVHYITDADLFSTYNVFLIPSVIINDKCVFQGIIPSDKQIVEALNQYLPADNQILLSEKKQNPYFLLLLIPLFLVLFYFVRFYEKTKQEVVNDTISPILSIPVYNSSMVGMSDSIQALYNFSESDAYQMTFIEFGSVGCIACKKMEPVVEIIKEKYKGKVKIVFYNVATEQGSRFAEYFRIELIPCQLLLNKNAEEFFRHTDVISVEELEKQFNIK